MAVAPAPLNVHVFGAAGLLGRELVSVFRAAGARVSTSTHVQCDISNHTRIREVLSQAPRGLLILNAAGYTNLDAAETDRQPAYLANAIGPHNLALVARELDATLVHFSTDFVFDGQKGSPYDEFDNPSPLSVYARSKWQGEQLVRQSCPRHFIVRTASLYGRGGNNFASLVLSRARAGERLRIDGERTTSPTWTRALAEQVRVLVSTPFYGTYHAVCQGAISWSQFAQEILRLAGLPNPIDPVPTEVLGHAAPRPKHPILANHLLGLRGLDRMPDWRSALARYVSEEVLP